VNADPGFAQTTHVLDAFSDRIVDIFGSDVGAHARTAIGVAALPMNSCVIVAAEVEIRSS
jgi:enamine deaminase RidA (YjgF/YER057c/UK114 family)